jgi:hypothetical protein
MKSQLLIAAAATTVAGSATGLALAADLPVVGSAPSPPAPKKAHSDAWKHDHNRLLGRHVRLIRKLHGDNAARHAMRDHSDWSNRHLSVANKALRRQLKAHSASAASTTAVPAILQRIAQCESGGNPHAIDASGTYRGKYQFDLQTWHANGGTGDPATAPEAQQDRIAMKLYQARGTQPWPVCGR